MKSFLSTLVIAVTLSNVSAFSGSSFAGQQVTGAVTNSAASTMEYIPNGMSKEQWAKLKANDRKKTAGKNLGASGITTFKSRSFSDWQKAGGKNLFPVDPNTVKSQKELPYMQRKGGSADDSDLTGGKKGGWFGGGGNKKKAAPAAAPEQKKNWWTL